MRNKSIPMGLMVGLLETTKDTESVDALLREVVASGRITDEQASVIGARVTSGDHSALDQLWLYSYEKERSAVCRFDEDKDERVSYEEYGNRIALTLGIDGPRIAHAIAQAYEERESAERNIRDDGGVRDKDGASKHRTQVVTAG